jgi:hypothetical protein
MGGRVSEDQTPYRFESIALSSESTVVTEFARQGELREERYRSEVEFERDLFARLQAQAGVPSRHPGRITPCVSGMNGRFLPRSNLPPTGRLAV